MSPRSALDVLNASPVMPVVVIKDADKAVPMAKALISGGIRVIEVTLRTPAALEAISRIAREVPEALVGAGTILSQKDLKAAEDAGATFTISPGATPALLAAGRSATKPYIPAISTASELMAGLEAGYEVFKFFPAETSGGAAAVKSLGGPFPHVKFCPTGGISLKTAPAYLSLPNVACIGGSWLVPDDAMSENDFARIEALAREASMLRR